MQSAGSRIFSWRDSYYSVIILTATLLAVSQLTAQCLTWDDAKHYLTDPLLPAHPFKASCSQDDGGKVVLLVQLLQTSIQVATLEAAAQENHPTVTTHCTQ